MNKSIRIISAGGLGNQILQYFAALAIKNELSNHVIFDISKIDLSHSKGLHNLTSFFEIEQNIDLRNISRNKPFFLFLELFRKISLRFKRNIIIVTIFEETGKKQTLSKIKSKLKDCGLIEIRGWFGDFDYFHSLPSQQRCLTLSNPSAKFDAYQSALVGSDYTAVHIRLGDYLSKPHHYGVLSKEYYRDAFDKLGIDERKNKLVVFTNDKSKVSQFLDLNLFPDYLIIDDDPTFDPAEVMKLMSGARTIVVANSTFSYVAALIAGPETTVVYPRYNRQGIEFIKNSPPSWVQVEPKWIEI